LVDRLSLLSAEEEPSQRLEKGIGSVDLKAIATRAHGIDHEEFRENTFGSTNPVIRFASVAKN
jgi:hypothetical protein